MIRKSFIFFAMFIFLLQISAQEPQKWWISEPSLTEQTADRGMEMLINIHPNFSQKILQDISQRVERLCSVVGLKMTPVISQSPALKLRTLWHDIHRLYYCIGVDGLEEIYKVPKSRVAENMEMTPEIVRQQIYLRIEELSKVIGIP